MVTTFHVLRCFVELSQLAKCFLRWLAPILNIFGHIVCFQMIFKQRTRKIVDRATELQYTQTHKIDGSQFQTVRKEHEKTVQTLMKKLHARKKNCPGQNSFCAIWIENLTLLDSMPQYALPVKTISKHFIYNIK